MNEAFEKHFAGIKPHIGKNTYTRMGIAWQAASQHYEAKIAEMQADAEIGKLVRSKMVSGNDVPVERCHITRAEIEALEKTNESGV